jgi:acetylornithine deacetylase/succinyl-diaminopimelate desuccinylase-like protein
MLGPFPQQEFFSLHERLVLTPGPSHGEGPRRALLREFLGRHGVAADEDEAGNLSVRLGGPGAWAETVVLDAHIDVVERGYAERVLRTAETLTGLGVGDNLTAVALLALATVRLARQPLSCRRPVLVLFSVGEEGLGNLCGMRHVVARQPGSPYLLVSFDGSADHCSMTGLGSRRFRFRVSCAGGHSWSSFGAPNAIEVLVDALGAVKARYLEACQAATPVLTFNLGTIRGGEGINSIAREADATFEFRSVSEPLLDAMGTVVARVAESVGGVAEVAVQYECIGARPAAAPVEAERVSALVLPAWEPLGRTPTERPMSTNINPALAAGWPAICVGLCTPRHSHREDEEVLLASIEPGWQCLDRLWLRLQA